MKTKMVLVESQSKPKTSKAYIVRWRYLEAVSARTLGRVFAVQGIKSPCKTGW